MKKIKLILSLGAVAATVWFTGCSKNKNTTSGSAPVSTDTGGPMAMKIKWQVGKEYDQRLTLTQDNETKVPGRDKPMDQKMTMTEDYSMSALKQLPDGDTQLELNITGFKIDLKMGDRSLMNFDSASDAPADAKNPAATAMRAIVGMKFQYEVDDSGNVDKITGLDDAKERFASADPQTKAALGSMFTEDMVKQMARRNFGLPEKPVKVGDHWPVQLDMKSGPIGTLDINMDVTLKGYQDHEGKKCALMEYTGSLTIKPDPDAATKGMDVSVESSSMNGSMWFDPELAMVVDSLSDQSFTLKIVAKGQTLHSQIKQLVGVKLVLLSDLAK